MKKKTKTVKAWAVLDEDNKLLETQMGKKKPTIMYLRSWGPYDIHVAVPCTITYTI